MCGVLGLLVLKVKISLMFFLVVIWLMVFVFGL